MKVLSIIILFFFQKSIRASFSFLVSCLIAYSLLIRFPLIMCFQTFLHRGCPPRIKCTIRTLYHICIVHDFPLLLIVQPLLHCKNSFFLIPIYVKDNCHSFRQLPLFLYKAAGCEFSFPTCFIIRCVFLFVNYLRQICDRVHRFSVLFHCKIKIAAFLTVILCRSPYIPDHRTFCNDISFFNCKIL